MNHVVVRGALALYTDPRNPPIADGWVEIEGGNVVAVGRGTPPSTPRVIDAAGCLVVPGLVCAHHHLFQGSSRGVPTEGGLEGWLREHYTSWASLQGDDVATAAQLSIAQLLLGGCTTVAAFEYLHPPGEDFITPVVAAARLLGIRLSYVRGTAPALEGALAERLTADGVDLDRLVEPADRALREIRATLASPTTERLRWATGPTTPILSDGGEFQQALNAIADEAGVPIHTHFHPLDNPAANDEDGFSMAQRLGLVRPGNWLAHGSRLTLADVARLGASQVGVVHCPSSSLLLGYPLVPLAEWRRVSDRVAVAVDGAASNDRGSMIAETQLTYYLQGQRHLHDAASMAPEDCLELVTTAAARVIGWEGLGSLVPGSPGDVACFDLSDLDSAGGAPTPGQALHHFFRTHQGARARTVLVGGDLVVDDATLVGADEARIIEAANRSAAHLRGAQLAPLGVGHGER